MDAKLPALLYWQNKGTGLNLSTLSCLALLHARIALLNSRLLTLAQAMKCDLQSSLKTENPSYFKARSYMPQFAISLRNAIELSQTEDHSKF